MTAKSGAIGKHDIVADVAIVSDVRVRHEQVVAAYASDAVVMGGSAIDRAVLAKHIAVTDFQPRRLALVLLVLGRIADRGELEDPVVGADRGGAVDDDMGPDHGARPDLDIGTDDGERSNLDVRSQPRLGRHDGVGVDHLPVSGATIISAWATSLSPTKAAVEKRQIPLKARSSRAVRMSWSPGSTGLRKRALSMPTK